MFCKTPVVELCGGGELDNNNYLQPNVGAGVVIGSFQSRENSYKGQN